VEEAAAARSLPRARREEPLLRAGPQARLDTTLAVSIIAETGEREWIKNAYASEYIYRSVTAARLASRDAVL